MRKNRLGRKSMLAETLRRTLRSPVAKFGAALLGLMVLVCACAPLLTRYGPIEMDYGYINAPPCAAHPLGTDELGRDMLSRLLYGGRTSLIMGFCASLLGNGIGVIIGCFAGYFGGWVETLSMRFMDILSSLPDMLLCILISTTLGTGFFNTVLALSIGQIPSGVRMIRGQILSERGKEYLEAAESINCSKPIIMFKHLLPNVISPTIVVVTMGIGSMITQAASLSFIGLGIRPPNPEWGAMLSAGKGSILTHPNLIMLPGIMIAITILSINLIGDGLRDALDPKLRK